MLHTVMIAHITDPCAEPFLHVTRLGPLLPSKTWTIMQFHGTNTTATSWYNVAVCQSQNALVIPHIHRQAQWKWAHSECKPDDQLVVERLAPLAPLLHFGWQLAELPAGAAALPLPAALQEDPAFAHIYTVIVMCYQCVDTVIVVCCQCFGTLIVLLYQCADTVVMMCYQCAALHDVVRVHEHS